MGEEESLIDHAEEKETEKRADRTSTALSSAPPMTAAVTTSNSRPTAAFAFAWFMAKMSSAATNVVETAAAI